MIISPNFTNLLKFSVLMANSHFVVKMEDLQRSARKIGAG